MDIDTLTIFFKYCTIINLLCLSISAIVLRMDLPYNIHSKLGIWKGSKEAYTQMTYSIVGNFKILWFVFNLVPYVVLSFCMQ